MSVRAAEGNERGHGRSIAAVRDSGDTLTAAGVQNPGQLCSSAVVLALLPETAKSGLALLG
jgi:hypothetical protein